MALNYNNSCTLSDIVMSGKTVGESLWTSLASWKIFTTQFAQFVSPFLQEILNCSTFSTSSTLYSLSSNTWALSWSRSLLFISSVLFIKRFTISINLCSPNTNVISWLLKPPHSAKCLFVICHKNHQFTSVIRLSYIKMG